MPQNFVLNEADTILCRCGRVMPPPMSLISYLIPLPLGGPHPNDIVYDGQRYARFYQYYCAHCRQVKLVEIQRGPREE